MYLLPDSFRPLCFLGSAGGGKYRNDFWVESDGSLCFCWFPGRGQSLAHRSCQLLLYGRVLADDEAVHRGQGATREPAVNGLNRDIGGVLADEEAVHSGQGATREPAVNGLSRDIGGVLADEEAVHREQGATREMAVNGLSRDIGRSTLYGRAVSGQEAVNGERGAVNRGAVNSLSDARLEDVNREQEATSTGSAIYSERCARNGNSDGYGPTQGAIYGSGGADGAAQGAIYGNGDAEATRQDAINRSGDTGREPETAMYSGRELEEENIELGTAGRATQDAIYGNGGAGQGAINRNGDTGGEEVRGTINRNGDIEEEEARGTINRNGDTGGEEARRRSGDTGREGENSRVLFARRRSAAPFFYCGRLEVRISL